MGCGCGKRRASTVTSYELKMPDGATSEHDTRLEAQKANIAKGGGGKVSPAK